MGIIHRSCTRGGGICGSGSKMRDWLCHQQRGKRRRSRLRYSARCKTLLQYAAPFDGAVQRRRPVELEIDDVAVKIGRGANAGVITALIEALKATR